MQLVIVPILMSLIFGMLAVVFAYKTRRNCFFWAVLGVLLPLAVLYPYRSFKITPLDPKFSESLVADPIVLTKDIHIPHYPDAYNPSLIPYKDGYLLSFRVKYFNVPTYIQKMKNVRTSYLGLVELDQNLELKGEPYLLDIVSYGDELSSSAQDARLFTFGDKILLFFNDYGATRHRSSYALYVTELVEFDGKLIAPHCATLLTYENMQSIEKNWIPFESEGELYIIYSSQPHLILKPDLTTGECECVAITETESDWQWGAMRGGTTAASIDEGMLTFFHSSEELPSCGLFGKAVGRNYAMGAYIFEKEYPFAIKKITSNPLGAVSDYFHNRRKVIFPSGMVIKDNLIHVVWGKNDTNICVSTFDKDKLLSTMVPCLP